MPLLPLASSAPLPRYPLLPAIRRERHHQRLSDVTALVESAVGVRPPPTLHPPPVESLRRGDWVKLICGASFEDAADIRNLSLVYTLAGVDCIDCAAEESVVNAVRDGIEAAAAIARVGRPWVMVSVNDDREDVHFRKAEFNPEDCPSDCTRPCEMVCPANAISLERVSVGEEHACTSSNWDKLKGGVITERCYGCGRCFSVCPYDKIKAMKYVRDPAATSSLLKRDVIDAIEIHTSGRRTDLFKNLWNSLSHLVGHVKLVAVSLPDIGESTASVMNMLYSTMQDQFQGYNIWQLDGRPMSGDIGRGTTREAIAFAVRLASIKDKPHGFYQLAGGTNSNTIDSLKRAGLFKAMSIPEYPWSNTGVPLSTNSQHALISGIAYGGYARKIVGRVLRKMQTKHGHEHIEDYPEHLLEALREALALVSPVKCYKFP